MSDQYDYPVRLRGDCEVRAVSLMEMFDWLLWLAKQLPEREVHKLTEIAAYVMDSAGVLHVLGTEKAKAGALLQGHVRSELHAVSQEPEGRA